MSKNNFSLCFYLIKGLKLMIYGFFGSGVGGLVTCFVQNVWRKHTSSQNITQSVWPVDVLVTCHEDKLSRQFQLVQNAKEEVYVSLKYASRWGMSPPHFLACVRMF